MKRVAKLGMFSLASGTLALASVVLVRDTANARPPGPECGPTRQWSCALPGCPDCYEVLFEGTVCEKVAFEKKTGRVCSPEGS
jgi:hypothetical protein